MPERPRVPQAARSRSVARCPQGSSGSQCRAERKEQRNRGRQESRARSPRCRWCRGASSVGSRETATSDSGAFDYTVSEKDPTKPVVVQGVAGGVASGAPSVAGPAGSTAAASASQPGGQAAAIAAAKAQTAAMGLGPGPAETAATRDQGTGLAIDESLQSAGSRCVGRSVGHEQGRDEPPDQRIAARRWPGRYPQRCRRQANALGGD